MTLSVEPTNALIICLVDNTPQNLILTKEVAEELRQQIESSFEQQVNVLQYWAPLKSFRRIIAIFDSKEHAIKARETIKTNDYSRDNFRAYFTPNLIPDESKSGNLELPDAGKLWLISPPASPPVGWQSIREEHPNKETHFETSRLKEALERMLTDQTISEQRQNEQEISDIFNQVNRENHRVHGDQDRPVAPKLDTALRESSVSPGKIRRYTLLESPVDGTSDDPKTPVTRNPSIVLEWDDNDHEDKAPHLGNQKMTLRTERPPL